MKHAQPMEIKIQHVFAAGVTLVILGYRHQVVSAALAVLKHAHRIPINLRMISTVILIA